MRTSRERKEDSMSVDSRSPILKHQLRNSRCSGALRGMRESHLPAAPPSAPCRKPHAYAHHLSSCSPESHPSWIRSGRSQSGRRGVYGSQDVLSQTVLFPYLSGTLSLSAVSVSARGPSYRRSRAISGHDGHWNAVRTNSNVNGLSEIADYLIGDAGKRLSRGSA